MSVVHDPSEVERAAMSGEQTRRCPECDGNRTHVTVSNRRTGIWKAVCVVCGRVESQGGER